MPEYFCNKLNFSYLWGKTNTFFHLLFHASLDTGLCAAEAGSEQFRADCDTDLSGKTKGGGVIFFFPRHQQWLV